MAWQMKPSRSTIWNLIKIVIAISLIGVVFSKTNLKEVISLRSRLSFTWLAASFFLVTATTGCIARRYWILIKRQVPFPQFLNLVILQNALSNFIATSAGAVSYLTLLRTEYHIRIRQGVFSLIVAKVGDLLAVCLVLGIASYYVWSEITVLHGVILVILTASSLCLLLFFLAITLHRPFISMVYHLVDRLQLCRYPIFTNLLKLISELEEQNTTVFFRSLAPVIGFSCLIILLTSLLGYCNVKLFAVQITPWPVIFMTSLIQILTMVPIQVFGGLGLYDVTVLYLYGLFGIPSSEIASVVISLRLIAYLQNLLLLAYLPLEKWARRKARDRSDCLVM